MCDGGDLAEEILLDVKVTAVLKIGDFVLAGVGGNVELYSGSDFRKVGLIRVFQGASVHGLARDHAGQQEDVLQVMIWGGKHWAIIDLKDPQRPKFLIPEQIAEDWILDCCRSSDQLLLLTAHNQVLEQDLDPKSPLLRRRFVCDEKCILYSGSLVAGGGIVLAGTVFSELLVWSLTEGTVWHRIKGHEGVIFSVSFNPQERLLCTTSDDRSSRLWKVDIQVYSSNPDR